MFWMCAEYRLDFVATFELLCACKYLESVQNEYVFATLNFLPLNPRRGTCKDYILLKISILRSPPAGDLGARMSILNKYYLDVIPEFGDNCNHLIKR
jgi:hypothetical protein